MKTLKKVGTEMARHVLAYNLKRVMNIMVSGPLSAAMSAAQALVGVRSPIRPTGRLEPQIPARETP